jgi:hypothetical protein
MWPLRLPAFPWCGDGPSRRPFRARRAGHPRARLVAPWDVRLLREPDSSDVLIRTPDGTRRFTQEPDGSFLGTFSDPGQPACRAVGSFSVRPAGPSAGSMPRPGNSSKSRPQRQPRHPELHERNPHEPRPLERRPVHVELQRPGPAEPASRPGRACHHVRVRRGRRALASRDRTAGTTAYTPRQDGRFAPGARTEVRDAAEWNAGLL